MITTLSINNLYQFYNEIGNNKEYSHHITKSFNTIESSSYSWPRYIYNLMLEDGSEMSRIQEISNLIKLKLLPPFILHFSKKNILDLDAVYEENGLRKIDVWPIMTMSFDEKRDFNFFSENFHVKIVKNIDEMADWYSIVKSVLFDNKQLDKEIFYSLFPNNKFIFLLGYFNGKPVSTAMLFFDQTLAGLYMVATKNEERGKGFGNMITIESIQVAKRVGKSGITLQSSRMAYSLYEKIGFKYLADIDVYWMLGNNFK
jgi:ribosomal protein S18 acetylase RimI-like enzyme